MVAAEIKDDLTVIISSSLPSHMLIVYSAVESEDDAHRQHFASVRPSPLKHSQIKIVVFEMEFSYCSMKLGVMKDLRCSTSYEI